MRSWNEKRGNVGDDKRSLKKKDTNTVDRT